MNENKPSDDELRAKLTAEEYAVTQQKGTERAFTGKYVEHKEDGTYRCVCCEAELFSSDHKYDSGSGWPSFWLPLAGDAVRTRTPIRATAWCAKKSCVLPAALTWATFSPTDPNQPGFATA